LKKGQKATIKIPPELGYGNKKQGSIPANSTLIFELEIVDVEQPKAGICSKVS
jgi:FKBP-type peptidyl-prolyl cis-trans isomerase